MRASGGTGFQPVFSAYFFAGVSSPSFVHWRPTAFTSFGADTLGTLVMM